MKLAYFKVYRDFIIIARELENEARGRLFLALMEYINGEEPTALTGAERIAFLMMKMQIDRDAENYDDVCLKRKNAGEKGAKARWEKKEASEKKADAVLPYGINDKNSKCHQEKEKDKEQEKEKEILNPLTPLKGAEIGCPTGEDPFRDVQASLDARYDLDTINSETDFFACTSGYGENEVPPSEQPFASPLEEAIEDFKAFRKSIRSPLTDRAVILLREKLDELSGGDESIAVDILHQSIVQGWKGVFPLKNDVRPQSIKHPHGYEEHTFTKEQFDGLIVDLDSMGDTG